MTQIFNFSAGPAVLPKEVLQQAASEMLDWHGSGMSVMEMSHRGPEFISIYQQAEADLRELLAVPSHYKILFLQGGGLGENAVVPMNLVGRVAQPAQERLRHQSRECAHPSNHFHRERRHNQNATQHTQSQVYRR